AGLEGGSEHRVADLRGKVQYWTDFGDLVRFEPLGIDPVELIGEGAALEVPDFLLAVRQVQHAPLAEQEVVLQLGGKLLPQLQRMLVDRGALVEQVIRADDSGVAGHVAAGQPAPLQHRDIADPVVAGEVVRGGQAVPPGTDDDHLVVALRFRVAPELRRWLGLRRRHRCLLQDKCWGGWEEQPAPECAVCQEGYERESAPSTSAPRTLPLPSGRMILLALQIRRSW